MALLGFWVIVLLLASRWLVDYSDERILFQYLVSGHCLSGSVMCKFLLLKLFAKGIAKLLIVTPDFTGVKMIFLTVVLIPILYVIIAFCIWDGHF